jgi:hypothetical protein
MVSGNAAGRPAPLRNALTLDPPDEPWFVA